MIFLSPFPQKGFDRFVDRFLIGNFAQDEIVVFVRQLAEFEKVVA